MIPPESLPGSEQSSTAGILPPSLLHLQKRRKPGSNPSRVGTTLGEPCPQHPYFSNALGVLPWLIFTPWKAHPASASLPCSQAGGRKAGACGRSPCTHSHTHTHYSSLLSAPLPAPTPPCPPHSAHPAVSSQDGSWLSGYLQGWMLCPRLLLKEPFTAGLMLCLALPSLPGKQKTGGARWEIQHPAGWKSILPRSGG